MSKKCNKQKKAYLLFGKKQRTHERVDKAINETIKKRHASSHVISLYSSDISQVVKIRDVRKLQ